MLSLSDFHPYQIRACNHIIHNPKSALWLFMGSGKTSITLTSIAHLIRHRAVRSVLVVAPLRVVQSVWMQESRKWEHLKHLRFSLIHGTKEERIWALFQPADIFLINYEGLVWLSAMLQHYFINQGTLLPFDMLVLDESSKMKNHDTKRMEAIAPILHYFIYRVALTGTPAPNGLEDLFGQFLVIDGGQRLGTSYTDYISAYFAQDGDNGYKYKVTEAGEKWIHQNVSDIVLEMSQEDYLQLPDLIINDIYVDLSPKHRRGYEELERELFTELDNGVELEVMNEVGKVNKCLAAGTEVLTEDGWLPIEQCKPCIKVWDGVEWVSHQGVSNQGAQSVVNLDGVWLTGDHKVLTDRGWRSAAEIIDGESSNRFNREKVRLPDSFETRGIEKSEGFNNCKGHMDRSVCMWKRVRNYRNKSSSERAAYKILRMQALGGGVERKKGTWDDSNSTLGCLVQYAFAMQQSSRQRLSKLWASWDKGLRKMEPFLQRVLDGYGSNIQRLCNHRAFEQLFGVLPGKLQMEAHVQTSKQQADECIYQNANRSHKCGSSRTPVQIGQGYHICADRERLEREGLVTTSRQTQTYDLINCGPRHRFVVRSPNSPPIIVHNCLQYSNGAAYTDTLTREWHPVHDAKLDALEDVVEESAGEPILVAYNYRPDAYRILKRFPFARNITGMSGKEFNETLAQWQRGEIRMLIGHPASMGHGIDGLQKRGNIMVWFGLNWSLELTMQFNARLHRQGQGRPVVCHRILTENTFDDVVRAALERKDSTQEGLRKAINEYRKQKERGLAA